MQHGFKLKKSVEQPVELQKDFKARPDSKGRIALGSRITKNVSSYIVHVEANGRLILDPMVEIPTDEQWLYDNKEALRRVKTGLRQAAEGEAISRGSFAKYVKDED